MMGGVGMRSNECSWRRDMAPVRRHDLPVQLSASDMAVVKTAKREERREETNTD